MPNIPQRMRTGSDYPIDLSNQSYFQAMADAQDSQMDVSALAERMISAAENYKLGGPDPGKAWYHFFDQFPTPAEQMPFSPADQETLSRINLFRFLDNQMGFGITPQSLQIQALERLGQKPTFAVGPNVKDSPPRELGMKYGQQFGPPPPPTEDYKELSTFGDALEEIDAPFKRPAMQEALEKALLKHFTTPPQ